MVFLYFIIMLYLIQTVDVWIILVGSIVVRNIGVGIIAVIKVSSYWVVDSIDGGILVGGSIMFDRSLVVRNMA